jgi:redox-sensitive bicupin YhaK (pirin superfamily)
MAGMLTLWPANERGRFQLDWLDSHHTFSFGDFYDPKKLQWRSLRVLNDDRIAGGGGFPPHPHRDMEIFSYVTEGALEHQDSMGNTAQVTPGRVQLMSAGTGVRHSEYNPSDSAGTHLLQIWFLPRAAGKPPNYQEKQFTEKDRADRLALLADPAGQDGAMTIGQDVRIYTATLAKGKSLPLPLAAKQGGWMQLVKGAVTLEPGGVKLAPGDGCACEKEPNLSAKAAADSEFLWFVFD